MQNKNETKSEEKLTRREALKRSFQKSLGLAGFFIALTPFASFNSARDEESTGNYYNYYNYYSYTDSLYYYNRVYRDVFYNSYGYSSYYYHVDSVDSHGMYIYDANTHYLQYYSYYYYYDYFSYYNYYNYYSYGSYNSH